MVVLRGRCVGWSALDSVCPGCVGREVAKWRRWMIKELRAKCVEWIHRPGCVGCSECVVL